MTRDHVIPATLLGQFAPVNEHQKKSRRRGLFVSTAHNRVPTWRRADKIGYVPGLYDHQAHPAVPSVEASWRGYEQLIPAAVQSVKSSGCLGLVDSWIWLKVLLPMVAGLYVRGPDFSHGKSLFVGDDNGTGGLFSMTDESDQNAARIPEQIRLLAPLMFADWEIVHTSALHPFITSDLGYTPIRKFIQDRLPSGVLVPLSSAVALRITKRGKSASPIVVSRALRGRWMTAMTVTTFTSSEVADCNRSMCRNARTLVAGAAPGLSDNLDQLATGRPDTPARDHEMWGTDRELHENCYEWWPLRAALSHPPDGVVRSGLQAYGWNVECNEPAGWLAPVALMPSPSTLGVTGVQRWGEIIKFDYNERPAARALHEYLSQVEP